MPQFFEKQDRWKQGLGLWVLAGMAFVLPVAAWSVSRLRIDNDARPSLSADNLQVRQSAWVDQQFRSEENLLITWDGSALEDPRVEDFAQRLLGKTDDEGIRRGGLKQVAAVQTPGQLLQRMTESKVDRAEALQRLTGFLVGPGPIWCQLTTAGLNQRARSLRLLKEQAAKRFGLELRISDRFGAAAEQSAGEDESEDAEAVESDSTANAAATGTESTDTPSPVEEIAAHDFQVSWDGMHSSPKGVTDFIAWAKELKIPVAGQTDGESVLSECFVHAGQPAAMTVVLSEAGRADVPGSLELIRETAETAGISRDSLHLAGFPVWSSHLNDAAWSAVWNPAAPWYLIQQRSILLLAYVVGLILTCWMLRSIRLGLMISAVSGLAMLLAVALVGLGTAPSNTVVLVMPPLVFTLITPMAIQIANCWKRAAGQASRATILNALLTASVPCTLAAVGAALTLGALLTSQLESVRTFGFSMAAGTLLTVLVVLYGGPTLLQSWQVQVSPIVHTQRGFWSGFGRLVVRYSTVITAASVVISSAALYGITKFRTETRSLAYLSPESRLQRDYKYLESNLGGTIPLETVISFGRQAREELSFTQRMEIVRTIEQQFRQLTEISGTLSLADFQPVHQQLSENAGLKERVAFKNKAKAIEANVRQDLRAGSMFQVAKAASEFNDAGDELWRITSLVPITSRLQHQQLLERVDASCRSVIRYHADTRHIMAGAIPVLQSAHLAIFETLFYASLLACGGIAIVMMFVARDFWAGLLSMLPNILPVAIVLGITAWKGIAVDVNMLIVSFVGLALSQARTAQVLACYRDGLISGISRRRAIVRALEVCGPALGQASVVVGLPMLLLTLSQMPLISRLGALTSGFMLTTMLASIMLTPALLAGPLGWLMFYAAQKQRNRLKAVTEDPESDEIDRHAAHVMPPMPHVAAESRSDSSRQFDTREPRQRKRRR